MKFYICLTQRYACLRRTKGSINVESSHTLCVGWDLDMEFLGNTTYLQRGLFRPSTSTSRTDKWRNYMTKPEQKVINKNIDCHDSLTVETVNVNGSKKMIIMRRCC